MDKESDEQFKQELIEAMMQPIDPDVNYGGWGCVFIIKAPPEKKDLPKVDRTAGKLVFPEDFQGK